MWPVSVAKTDELGSHTVDVAFRHIFGIEALNIYDHSRD